MSTNNRISNLVNTQVPFFVRSDHRTFVAFLEAYYEYLEQNSATLNQGKVVERAENLLNYIDVDKTLPDFSEKLYDTFLSLLPKNINTDKEVIIKNVQDFYRAKGTEKALKFILRILSDGDEAEVYYPKVDILRASAGKWYIQKSLRVRDITVANTSNTNRSGLDLFTSRLIRGASSNASATIERTDRYYESGLEVSELIISGDRGNFVNDETVYATITDDTGTYTVRANVFGGINAITVTNPGTGYSVGNTVIIESSSGTGANAYISKVSVGNISSMSVNQGGAGFVANGNILFSGGGGSGANAVYLTVDTSGTYHPNTYNIFTSIIQVVANTTLNTANYTNLNHAQVITPNANTYLINALSSFVFGPCGPITGVQLNSRGSGYVSVPIADAIANSVVKGAGILGRMEVTSRGLGYNVGDRIEFWSSTGAGANGIVSSVLGNGAINTVSFTANVGWITGGQGYSQSALPTANIRTNTGSGGIVTVKAILGDGESFNMATSTIGAVEEITVTARGDGYTSASTINLTQSGDGTAQAVATFISGVYAYPGRYLNDDGHLSSYNFLQNRDYYQNYSYVVKIQKALSEYKSYLEKITHPTGLKIFGEYLLENNGEDQVVYSNYATDTEILFRTGSYLVANTANASNIKISFTGHALTTNNNVYIEFISGTLANLSNGIYTARVTDNNTFYIRHANTTVSTNIGNVMFGRVI